jgi:hypothetical protein
MGYQKIAERLENALVNANHVGYDVKAILEKLSATASLEEKNKQQQGANAKQTRQIEENSQILAKQEQEKKENYDVVRELNELKQMGLDKTELKAIGVVVSKVGRTNGLTASEAMKKFTTDIESKYDVFVGFDLAVATKQIEIEDGHAKIEKLKVDYVNEKDAVDAVKVLHAKGMGNPDILAVKDVVEKSGSNLSTLANDIAYYGSLFNAKEKLEKIIKDLTAKKDKLEPDCDLLQSKKTGLEKSCEEFQAKLEEQHKALVNDMIDAGTNIS